MRFSLRVGLLEPDDSLMTLERAPMDTVASRKLKKPEKTNTNPKKLVLCKILIVSLPAEAKGTSSNELLNVAQSSTTQVLLRNRIK